MQVDASPPLKIDRLEVHRRVLERAEEFLREVVGPSVVSCGQRQWQSGGEWFFFVARGQLRCWRRRDGFRGDCVALWRELRGGRMGAALDGVAAWVGVSQRVARTVRVWQWRGSRGSTESVKTIRKENAV
jgi:hypothetical protein